MSAVRDLVCDDAEPLLPLVADCALDTDGDPALFAHLARCPSCQDALARLDLVDLALRRGGIPPTRTRTLRLSLPWSVAAAASLVALISGGALLARSSATPAAPAAQVQRIDRADGQPPLFLVIQPDGRVQVVAPGIEGVPAAPGNDAARQASFQRY